MFAAVAEGLAPAGITGLRHGFATITHRPDSLSCVCDGIVIRSGMMKTLTVRLPDALVTEIEQESRSRRVSKSDIVRERLGRKPSTGSTGIRGLVGDLVGSVKGLPPKLSSSKKKHLAEIIRGSKRHR
jgi:hypothetical protein